ncbi:morn repeat protein [Stylonychia lemnae]|uniref:Morn repeat protein n=1 Tax=Stylonychia lemnae TaxID=5949 RepID=A0A077ZW81_STYLE|nr:morn repeat protein [Stylonychia lemnae]|eukprot:CDW73841.1 morn repeat protein [Stylonychia lemnae]
MYDNKVYAMMVQNLKNLMTRIPNNFSIEMVRIIREINTFKLNHQNITKFYESYFTFEDEFVIVTELAESNLYALRENKELTNAQITDIMIQIVKGTIHLHDQNFKICDFGMAQFMTNFNGFVGKHFKAPEINLNEEFSYSSQVDIWSLGMILYYLSEREIIRLEGQQKVFEEVLNKMLQLSPLLRIDALQVLFEFIILLNNEPLDKHLEMEEEKKYQHNITNDRINQVANEIETQLGEFDLAAIDKIHPNSNRILSQYDQLITLLKSQKFKAIEAEVANTLNSDSNRKQQLCKDFSEILTKMARMIGQNDFQNIASKINLSTIDEDVVERAEFAVTISSKNTVVNEIIESLGDFNYGSIDKIHSNPNRVFKPLVEYTDGTIYQGEFDIVTNQRDGRGRQIYSSGSVYDGLWKNNETNGQGRVIYCDEQWLGDYYIGEWKDSKYHGYGKYYWKDGRIYEGQWVNNNTEGLGLFKFSNGDQQYGQWVNGKSEGVGVYALKSGEISLGQWKNCDIHGIQMSIPKDGGQIQIQKWQNHKFIQTLLKIDNNA